MSLEPSSHSVINTLRLPPAGIDAFEAIGLMAVECVSVLLHDLDVFCRGDHLITPRQSFCLSSAELGADFILPLRYCDVVSCCAMRCCHFTRSSGEVVDAVDFACAKILSSASEQEFSDISSGP